MVIETLKTFMKNKYLRQLALGGEISFADGKISILNTPMVMVSTNSIKKMTEDATAEGLDGIARLYFEGWTYGYDITYNLVKRYKLKLGPDRYQVTMNITDLCGFGAFRTIEFKIGSYSNFYIIDNPLALMFYKEGKKDKIDHYLRGMNAGGGVVVHEILMACIEFECAAENGKRCRHMNLSDELLGKVDKKLVESQYPMDILREKEMEYIKSKGHDIEIYTGSKTILPEDEEMKKKIVNGKMEVKKG